MKTLSPNRCIYCAFIMMTIALAQILSHGQTKGDGWKGSALVESQRETVPPEYIGAPLPLHDPSKAMMLGIPSLAISPGGRMWACWYSSVTYSKQHAFGEDENNFVTVVTSGDGGQTWKTAFVIEPDFSGPRRAFDPEIWMAPDGCLHITWTDRIGTVKSPPEDDQLWMLTLDDPETVPETLPLPRIIATGVMMCKPTFLSDGTWALPVARWQDDHSSGMVVSTDGGKTFSLRGGAGMAKERRSFDEHMFVERSNGEIVCFSRAVQSQDGLLRASSTDGGKTWSELLPFEVKHTSARVFITRLDSGHWLMVKHGPLDKSVGRTELTAYVSLDEGRTWQGGLLLDGRKGISYPDGQQTQDGTIHIIYDYDRLGAQEILMASFTEEDVLAGKVVSKRCLLQQKVAGGHVIHLRGNLDNAFSAMTVGKKATVAFFGGSITEMTGWKDLVMEDLKARFPQTEFKFITAGIASLGSTPHAFRFEKDVLERGVPDLLFVEAAVNDHTNGFGPREQVLGMEGIVRHALKVNPHMDIIFLHFIYDPFIPLLDAGEIPDVILNHERVANHYHLTSIDLAQEIGRRMRQGEFDWKTFGGTHPSPFGHKYYAAAIGEVFDNAVKPSGAYVRAAHQIPEEPLEKDCYQKGRLLSPDSAVKMKGFRLEKDWIPSDKAGTRKQYVHVPTLVCEDGGSLVLEFDGTAIGLYCTCGPNAGVLSYTIDGKAYPLLDTYTQWSKNLHIPWVHMLANDLEDGHHTLRLKVLKGERSGCYIRNFTVN